MSSSKPRDSRPTIGLLSEVGGSSYHNDLWTGFANAAPELDVNLICYVGGTINASFYGFDDQRHILYDLVDAESVDGLVEIPGCHRSDWVGQFLRQDAPQDCQACAEMLRRNSPCR